MQPGPDFLGRTCHAFERRPAPAGGDCPRPGDGPALLVADEITAMLDPATGVILRELKTQQQAHSFSMLFITHDIHLARKTADRVYVLEGGRLAAQGAALNYCRLMTTPYPPFAAGRHG